MVSKAMTARIRSIIKDYISLVENGLSRQLVMYSVPFSAVAAIAIVNFIEPRYIILLSTFVLAAGPIIASIIYYRLLKTIADKQDLGLAAAIAVLCLSAVTTIATTVLPTSIAIIGYVIIIVRAIALTSVLFNIVALVCVVYDIIRKAGSGYSSNFTVKDFIQKHYRQKED